MRAFLGAIGRQRADDLKVRMKSIAQAVQAGTMAANNPKKGLKAWMRSIDNG